MTLVVPNQGEQILLDAATGKTAATTLTLRLFSNNYTPVAGTTESNVTQVSGGGYAGIALTPSGSCCQSSKRARATNPAASCRVASRAT